MKRFISVHIRRTLSFVQGYIFDKLSTQLERNEYGSNTLRTGMLISLERLGTEALNFIVRIFH